MNHKIKNKEKLKTIIKYTIIFLILISLIISIFIKHHKSFVWINVSNDGLDQHLINLYYFKALFKNFLVTKSLNTLTWNIGYGMDMFANLAYYIFGDFLSYFALITKTTFLDTLYQILIFIRLYLVGISFLIYGFHKNLSNKSNLIGALTYTFSAFSLFAMARHPYFINPLIIFPLLMLATDNAIEKDKPIFFILIVALMFISSFYFAYMMSICIMIYGIILILKKHKGNPKEIIKNFLTIFMYALIGVLLSSFILIPTAYAYLNSTRTDSQIYLYTIDYYQKLVSTLISTNNTGNWSIIGVSSIILAILPQFIKNRQNHRPILNYLIILLIPLIIPFIGSIFAGFSYPNNRWVFVINFILSLIIAITLDNNYKVNLKNNILFILIYALIILIINKHLNSQIIISLIIAILISIILKYHQKLKNISSILIIILLITNLSYNIYYMYDSNKYVSEFVESDALSLYDNANHQIPYLKEATNYLKEIDSSYYNTIIYPNNLYNLSIINDYNSISYFYSIVDNHYLLLSSDLENQELGINKEIKNFGLRTQITTLLNLKYLITTDPTYVPYGYELIKNFSNQTYIYRNNYPLSFANLYTSYLDEDTYNQLTPLEKENALLKATVIDDENNQLSLPLNKYQSNIKNISYTSSSNIENNQIIVDKKDNSLILNINPPKNSEIYLYIKNITYQPKNNLSTTAYNITVNLGNKTFQEGTKNKSTNPYYFENNNILINLGYYQSLDEEIILNFSSLGTYQFDSLEILAVTFDDLENNITNLNKSHFELSNYDYNYLSGTVNPETDGVLQFSTNYSKGWKVFVDDKEVKTFESNKTFLAINIQKGYHKIELKYTTPYKKLGMIISCLSLIPLIYIIIKNKKTKKK